MMRDDISMQGFSLSIRGPAHTLQSTCLQHFGSQDIEAKASRIALCGLNQPVQCFRVSVGHAMIEKSENRIIPVGDSSQQRLKRRFHLHGNTRSPLLIETFGIGSVVCLPDIEKALLQPIGGSQCGEVLYPGFQDQSLRGVQVRKATQQDISVVHQPASFGVAQRGANILANGFECFVCHLDYMEMVNDHLCLGQYQTDRVEVGTPHINTDQGYVRLLWHVGQEIDDGLFVAVTQQVNNAVIADICNHATGLIQQVNFVNAQCCADLVSLVSGSVFGVFGKNAADSPFVNTYIVCHTSKRLSERLLGKIERQALCHGMVLVHIGKFLKECLGTFSAFVATTDNQDTYALSSDWGIHELLYFRSVSIQQGAGTMWTAQNDRFLLSGNAIVVCVLRNVQNAPMCPAKNVQEISSMVQVLAQEFFSRTMITVKGGKRVLIHSTRYAELWRVYIVVLFYTMCRIAGCCLVYIRERQKETLKMNEIQQMAMVQLYYHVNMMKHHLDRNSQDHFWSQIRQNCPELIQAIDASFRSQYGWGKITFTWDLPSPAFDSLEADAQLKQLDRILEKDL